MVLLILAVVWAVYLFTWVRARRDRRGVNSISTFSRHLSVLERTSPARSARSDGLVSISSRPQGRPAPIYPAANYQPPRAGMSLPEARRRRRNVLVALAAAALVTMVLIPFVGSFMIALQLLTDALLGTYVLLLAHKQRLAVERRDKVRYLPHVGATEPAYLLQRSAN